MRHDADLSPLVTEDALVGRAPDDLDGRSAEVLGRAAGTLARRRGLLRGSFVLSAEIGGPAARAVRDGLVRGLLQAGHDVTDIGPASAEEHAFALAHLAHESSVRLTEEGERCRLTFLLDGQPLEEGALYELCAIAAAGDLSSGIGALRAVDVKGAFAAERARARSGRSTSVSAHPAPELLDEPPSLLEDPPSSLDDPSPLDEPTVGDDDVFLSSDEG